ncbi:DUF7289 family protein [Natronomonas sp. EA1]|uniref:DUF7289 family protein n=1 Tax=Natronomonas sp. EA1 TaxID=3421655 RepID=UPI003EBD449F
MVADTGPGISGDTRGQSETLGTALIIVLVVLGTSAVVALGAAAINDTESESRLTRAEHSMTLFDSRVSMVALGDSSVQTVSFGDTAGDFTVDPTVGTMTITHVDHDGTESPGDPSNDEVLYTGSLGAVAYDIGDSTIAYQGGGVWKQSPDGSTRMVSPPEFHYRDETLTLPIIDVVSSDSGAGGVRAKITPATNAFTRVYPDASETYAANASRTYANPVQNGYIRIDVQSPYYQGWAQYFESRTDGAVEAFDGNQTARVNLLTLGDQGPVTFTSVGDSIRIRGMDGGHALTDFSITLHPEEEQNSQFSNLQWSMYAEDGNTQFEIGVRNGGGGNLNCGDAADVVFYYSDDGGATYHGWKTNAFTAECYDSNGDGTDDAVRLSIDFMDTTVDMEYTTLKNRELVHFKPDGTLASDVQFTEHGVDTAATYNAGSTEDIDYLTAHYLALLAPNADLTVAEGNNAGQCYSSDEDCTASGGFIDYSGTNNVVTYLHITENRVEVELD